MDNELKLLLENFKKILKEDEVNNSDLALCIKKDSPDMKFVLYNYRQLLLYDRLVDIRKFSSYTFIKYIAEEYLIGMMSFRNQKHSHCEGSMEVQLSAVNKKYQGGGFGKMLYGLAMTYFYPKPIMADRGDVSKEASRVWKSLENNPKVEKLPPSKEPYVGKFDNIYSPKTKPKDDDCIVYDKTRDEINKAYRYSSGENKQLLNNLIKNHEKFLEILQSKYKLKSNYMTEILLLSARNLFGQEYRG